MMQNKPTQAYLLYTSIDDIPESFYTELQNRIDTFGCLSTHCKSPQERIVASVYGDAIEPDSTELTANNELTDAYYLALNIAGIVPDEFIANVNKLANNPKLAKYDVYSQYAFSATNDELRESIKNLLGVIKHG